VAPKAPLKQSDYIGTGFSRWEEELKHEQMVCKNAGHAEAGFVVYTTFQKNTMMRMWQNAKASFN
jgi:hypothetical protein